MSRLSLVFVCVLAAIANVHGGDAGAEADGGGGGDAEPACAVRARLSSGWVCGTRRNAAFRTVYASFRGVPYAKQPLGELRFRELELAEPWGVLNATTEGPVCPQTDILYGKLMQPQGMSEACIHANIHVPITALPTTTTNHRSAKELMKTPAVGEQDIEEHNVTSGLPILVFIHGGGFAFGSGDADLHGPEYLVANGVIVITFNYRLNVFGFLSLNSYQIPGNNGLRDMITLLRWVRENARNFGGNPDDVTIAGQSAGASAAHLLTLSPLARGLFKKAIIMSGTAIPSFYTTSPAYAQYIGSAFLASLGINSTDPDEIHHILVDMPLEKIMAVNSFLQDQTGLAVFFPVIEPHIPDVKAVLPEDTEVLLAKGYGSDIPLLIGFTDAECETFRKRFEEVDIIKRFYSNQLMILSPNVAFSVPPETSLNRAKEIEQRYSNRTLTLDNYIEVCSDQFFEYPALKVAEYRVRPGSAPTFLYQFSYDAFNSPLKEALELQFAGAGHIEDLTFIFLPASLSRHEQSDWDEHMRVIMAQYITNFMKFSHPTETEGEGYWPWRPLNRADRYLRYQLLHSPSVLRPAEVTKEQRSMITFFDTIFAKS